MATLTAQGASGCPADTLLGTGRARIYLGTANIPADVTLLNRHHGFALVLTSGDAVLRVIGATAKGRTVHVHLPTVPLAGGKEASFVRLRITVPVHHRGRHAWLRTPATCPASGHWTSRYRPTFDAPHGTEHLTATSPCHRPRQKHSHGSP